MLPEGRTKAIHKIKKRNNW